MGRDRRKNEYTAGPIDSMGRKGLPAYVRRGSMRHMRGRCGSERIHSSAYESCDGTRYIVLSIREAENPETW